MVLVDMFHWEEIRPGASPSHSPSRMAIRSRRDSGSRLVARGGFSRSLSKSSAIGGFLIIGGMPLSRRLIVVNCLKTRYATLKLSDSLNSLPV